MCDMCDVIYGTPGDDDLGRDGLNQWAAIDAAERLDRRGRAIEDAVSRPPAPPVTETHQEVIDAIISDIGDLDPSDYPVEDWDTLRVSETDLRIILERHLAASRSPTDAR